MSLPTQPPLPPPFLKDRKSSGGLRVFRIIPRLVLAACLGCADRVTISGADDSLAPQRGIERAKKAFKEIAPGQFQIGLVKLDQKSKSIVFPGVINMSQGLVEYALVSPYGKAHESILATTAQPQDIHVAMLLLQPSGTRSTIAATNGAAEVTGMEVLLSAEWTAGEKLHRHRFEELIINRQTKSTMREGPWVYNGSRVVGGTFLAQRDGQIVAVMADGDALVNNPQPGRENDEIWQINTNAVPAVGTPVRIIFQIKGANSENTTRP